MRKRDEERTSQQSPQLLKSLKMAQDLRKRTKEYALRNVRLFRSLPKNPEAEIFGKQLLRSSASVGAHYREAFRARSNAEFRAKLGVAIQELDESIYWLELMGEAAILKKEKLDPLITESSELIAVFVTCIKNSPP